MNSLISGKIPKSLLSLLSGTITPLAFSPYDIYPLSIISCALIIYIWLQSNPRLAFIYGYIFGLGFFGFGVSWLHISINLFGGVNLALSIVITALLIFFLSLFPAMTGYLSRKLLINNASMVPVILTVPATWTLSEWVRSWIFTGFPWLNVGYSQTNSVLNGIAPLLGVFGVSLAVVVTATAIVLFFQSKKAKQITLCSIVIIVWSLSWISEKQSWTNPASEKLSVALIQGSIPQEVKWDPIMRQPTLDLYQSLSQSYFDHDLIIWPEAAIPAYYHQVQEYLTELSQQARKNNARLLLGIPVREQPSGKYYNSIVLLGDDESFYFKKHLVPFGEYLPMKFLLKGIVDYLNIPISEFSAGPDVPPLLNTQDYKIGISICYEDTFGNEVIQALPQAGILVNISNDAWFGDSAAPHQHLQMARMRAMETGRYLLRATNTGVTAIINEKGLVLKRSPQFIPATLSGTALIFEGHTPYSRIGNYPVLLFCMFIVLFFIVDIYKGKNNKPAV